MITTMEQKDELKLGIDFENTSSIVKKTKLRTRQALWYRIKYLEKHGDEITTLYDSKRSPYWLRGDADKIMNVKFTRMSKKRKEQKC